MVRELPFLFASRCVPTDAKTPYPRTETEDGQRDGTWAVKDRDKSVTVEVQSDAAGRMWKETALIAAARDGQLEMAKSLLASGGAEAVNVDAKDRFGRTALSYAAENSHLDLVKLLLEQQADVNAPDNNLFTVLMYAAQKKAVEQGDRIYTFNPNGDNVPVAKLLIESKADVNAKTKQVFEGNADAVEQSQEGKGQPAKPPRPAKKKEAPATAPAAENGGEPKKEENSKEVRQTALMMAATEGNIELVRLLEGSGAEVNLRRTDNGYTALMLAAENGKVDVATLLIEKGANAKLRSKDGRTAAQLLTDAGWVSPFLTFALQHADELSEKPPAVAKTKKKGENAPAASPAAAPSVAEEKEDPEAVKLRETRRRRRLYKPVTPPPLVPTIDGAPSFFGELETAAGSGGAEEQAHRDRMDEFDAAARAEAPASS